jgi:hypothetical protein
MSPALVYYLGERFWGEGIASLPSCSSVKRGLISA